MDTNMRNQYTCDLWQPENSVIPTNELFIHEYETSFYIKIVLQDSTKLLTQDQLTEAFEDTHACCVSYSYLLDLHKESSTINTFVSLSSINLEKFPEIVDAIVHQINLYSQDMMHEPSNVWQDVMPMYILISLDNNLYEEIADEEPRDSSMECLDYYKIKKGDLTEQTCAICLENLEAGMKVARTPCMHLYHWTCIYIWLAKSTSCPMCRFEPVMLRPV